MCSNYVEDRQSDIRYYHTMFDKFVSEFSRHLHNSHRWESFLLIAKNLSGLSRPIHIGETGCLRNIDNWLGDGQSTRLWDFIARETKGTAFTVDLSPESCAAARSVCPNTRVIEGDSILYLASLEDRLRQLDLLFLDSYDYAFPYCDSMLHHSGELAASYHKLKSGCLIAVDDCHGPDSGKHVYVRKFFQDLGVVPLIEAYVTVWKKP